MKERVDDPYSGSPLALYYFQKSMLEGQSALGEFNVNEVIERRINIPEELEFLTVREGYHTSVATWEPVNQFLHRFPPDFVKYC